VFRFFRWFSKRCNIGLEVAAAPSLLLLDEPTSGLDSTAAMEICQVLKDLARVSSLTVAMVIHQPRVEIWHQLDELLLLAPGGRTVYQGPQRLAVAYFMRRFGVQIAAHENPADALMDRIAEQGDEFVRGWAEENGPALVAKLRVEAAQDTKEPLCESPPIVIPEEDEREQEDSTSSKRAWSPEGEQEPALGVVPVGSSSSASVGQAPASASGSCPQAVLHVLPKRVSYAATDDMAAPLSPKSKLRHLSASGDSALVRPAAFDSQGSLRQTAGFFRQVQLAFVRSLWKQLANPQTLALEVGLGMLAGIMMGALMKVIFIGSFLPPYTLLSPAPNDRLIGNLVFNCGLAISLAAVSAGVSVFGEEQVLYRREISAGHSHLAYYLGVNLAQFPRLFLDGLHFAFVFHILSNPMASFGQFLSFAFLLYSAIYGLAFIVSFLVSRRNAPLLGVVLALTFSSMTAKGGQPEAIQFLSASRWAAEGLFTVETAPYTHVMSVARTADQLGYTLDRFPTDMALMFLIGLFYRLIAYLFMRCSDRKLLTKSN
jgi:hypothetical protein